MHPHAPNMNNLDFEEGIWCEMVNKDMEGVLIGCMYKSPNTSHENEELMFKLLKDEYIQKFKHLYIVGDFNYPNIKWQGEWSGAKNNKFIESIRYSFLDQLVTKPTRKRIGQDIIFWI